MKKDVMHQLPPKTRQMVVLDPGSVKVNKNMKQTQKLVDQIKVCNMSIIMELQFVAFFFIVLLY